MDLTLRSLPQVLLHSQEDLVLVQLPTVSLDVVGAGLFSQNLSTNSLLEITVGGHQPDFKAGLSAAGTFGLLNIG
ncbi:hypothetical protein IPH70_00515 [Candidatus Roizmanbacteria bacterium]|nr:MAG: hypothetical protein IPH70_00515 [Candidatus Roizmanbacteria bacterium]